MRARVHTHLTLDPYNNKAESARRVARLARVANNKLKKHGGSTPIIKNLMFG